MGPQFGQETHQIVDGDLDMGAVPSDRQSFSMLEDESFLSTHIWQPSTSNGPITQEHPCRPGPSIQSNSMARTEFPGVPASLTHLPSSLIGFWFAQVCPVWSAFDSTTNYNRDVPSNTWSTSEVVFHTLQSMAASFLANTVPHLKAKLPSLTMQATVAIKERVQNLKRCKTSQVTADLIFAVLGMGTSSHWINPIIDSKWLDDARELLDRWGARLQPHESPVHAYFKYALVHWRMLMSVADSDLINSNLELRRHQTRHILCSALQLDHNTASTKQPSLLGPLPCSKATWPSSWCGVSAEVVDLFGQAVTLCRDSRARQLRTSTLSIDAARDVLCDAKVAQELENELINMDMQQTVSGDEPLLTWDDVTPISHLVQTAEAYRLAALLQLYLTFEELQVSSGFSDCNLTDSTGNHIDHSTRSERLVTLATTISTILERIPPESRSRSIHPILYLSVAAGLRFETDIISSNSTAVSEGVSVAMDPSELESLYIDPALLRGGEDAAETSVNEHREFSALDPLQHDPLAISSSTLAIANARRFVSLRLSILQYSLPTRPLDILSDLVKAIWKRYDESNADAQKPHWLDVMVDSGLQTLFK
ncbi:hypothetical protein PRZ48_006627 [Zasmidium cellare]|uniref:Uncharacterized protein n=1 Tax=Zasmidium cellare TaxID=395010 RepID=A0ABR0ENM9_ZASCE|nr:hypothetical protein PRZ48_006627 [Zasmidium cellare]